MSEFIRIQEKLMLIDVARREIFLLGRIQTIYEHFRSQISVLVELKCVLKARKTQLHPAQVLQLPHQVDRYPSMEGVNQEGKGEGD